MPHTSQSCGTHRWRTNIREGSKVFMKPLISKIFWLLETSVLWFCTDRNGFKKLYTGAAVLLGARRHVIIIKRGWSFTEFYMEVYSLLREISFRSSVITTQCYHRVHWLLSNSTSEQPNLYKDIEKTLFMFKQSKNLLVLYNTCCHAHYDLRYMVKSYI